MMILHNKKGERVFYKEVMNELVAQDLMKKGFEPIKIRSNINEPGKTVYTFEKSSKFTMEFLKSIDKIERGIIC